MNLETPTAGRSTKRRTTRFLLGAIAAVVTALAAVRFYVLPSVADACLREGDRLGEAGIDEMPAAAREYRLAATLYGWCGDPAQRALALYLQAWHQEPHHDPAQPDWAVPLAGFEAVADAFAALDDDLGLARSLYWIAHVNEPGNHPDGAWPDAAARYAQAVDVFERCDRQQLFEVPLDAELYVRALYQSAYARMPSNNPDGSWRLAAGLYGKAAQAARRAGQRALEAQSTHQQAYCMQPSQDPAGSWARAAALFAEAAGIRAQLGDVAGQALSLHEQAVSVVEGDPDKMTDEARRLFGTATRMRRAAGDEAGARATESWLAHGR